VSLCSYVGGCPDGISTTENALLQLLLLLLLQLLLLL